MESRILYTRAKHGTQPVTIHGKGRERVFDLGGERYSSFRSLMTHLNGGQDPKVGFERYFGLGSHGLTVEPLVSPFVMFSAKHGGNVYIRVTRRGVDLSKKWRDIERLFYAGFRTWLQTAGYTREDFEEVLQDIHLGLLSRNQGRGAWDPERSSFGHYVHMVCRSVVTNHYNRRKRRLSREKPGVLLMRDDGLQMGDAAEADRLLKTPSARAGAESTLAVEDLGEWIRSSRDHYRKDAQVALEILPYVNMGMRRGEIAEASGQSLLSVGRALAFIRESAARWRRG